MIGAMMAGLFDGSLEVWNLETREKLQTFGRGGRRTYKSCYFGVFQSG